MIGWILIAVVVFWALFIVIMVRATRTSRIRRERKQSGNWEPGKSGSPTSSSRPSYSLTADRLEKKGSKIILHGSLRGCRPRENETAYLETADDRTVVLILSVREEDMPEAGSDVRVRMVLFGAPAALRGKLTEGAAENISVTNRRKRITEEAPASDRPDNAPEPKTETELHYPITVRTPLRESLAAAGATLLGLFALVLGILGIAKTSSGEPAGFAVFAAIGLLMAGFGIFFLLSHLGFGLTIDHERVTVRKFFRSTVYHIDNLYYRVHLASDRSEKWILDITNAAGGQAATLNSRYDRYAEVLEAFRQAAERRRETRRREMLGRYLRDTVFCILGQTIETGSASIVVPRVLTHKENGTHTLFLYDREADALTSYPGAPLIPARMEDAVEMIGSLKLDVLTVFPSAGDGEPLEVTEELWQSLQEECSPASAQE